MKTVSNIITGFGNVQFLHIDFVLPTLNEYINAERSNRYASAKMKKIAEKMIGLFIARSKLIPAISPVMMNYYWRVKNRRKDKDNIAFGMKFIQDALVKNGILKNDGWNDIANFSHIFILDKDEGVSVEIAEILNGR